MKRRKICVITGTRAEYGLLTWLMKEINGDRELDLQVIATGMHLSPEFGLTYKQIEQDGFQIDARVEMLLSSDSPVGISKSIGLGTIGFADAYERLQPDLVVILGDRFEILAAAQAAMIARIPIAHLHGGETTEGVIDEAIRHAITKMSHLHFVAAEPYRQRVIQLGEDPQRVFNFGAPGIDNIVKLELLDREEFENSISFSLGQRNFLVTYHPVTLYKQGPERAFEELLRSFDEYPEAHVIFTKSNADTDGRIINQMIDEYVRANSGRAVAFTSLGQLRYLSAIQHVDVVIGNSSSGLIEVPLFKKATINLGDRQSGRLKADSVIDCNEKKEDIVNAISIALSQDFQTSLAHIESLYGAGNVAIQIKNVLKMVNLDGITVKKFYDMLNMS
ncbi:UDP-N-acetylglucosamine 2-epimerase [Cohnella panacarvi]|uniref:UDP-N-acetylglucosamine 2-epimerase n=1 Tax=Cohnella panacarvi TaxID=400776 RepID=UPI00047E0D29|nr:UDP-N-acetylglucosamine 2-epimerase [Cohnella panacarvi]